MMPYIQEPHVIERIEAAKERARKIVYGLENSDDTIRFTFKLIISERIGKGLFDPYYDDLTLDELALEAYLWLESRKKMMSESDSGASEERTSELINENRKDVEAQFNDWEKDDGLNDDQARAQAQRDFEAMEARRKSIDRD